MAWWVEVSNVGHPYAWINDELNMNILGLEI
jgi:hypothetical protein